jgi:hypothetical protein
MGDTLAIMFTMTTYGTWLRGDLRGWVDEGATMPPDPVLEEKDRQRMKHEPFVFAKGQLLDVGTMIGESLRSRLQQRILALTVRTWHVHFVVIATKHPVSAIAKCAKDAVRWGLRVDRPIWTDGYDKRYCFDGESVRSRIGYVQRHNSEMGLPENPWPFIETYI